MFTAPFMRIINKGLQFSELNVSEETVLQKQAVTTSYGSMDMRISDIEGRKHKDTGHYNGKILDLYIFNMQSQYF